MGNVYCRNFSAASFSGQPFFWGTNLFKIKISTEEFLFQSRSFFATSIFSEQLLFQLSYLFKETLFQKSCFIRKSIGLRIYFLGELLFESSYFLKRATLYYNIFLLRRYFFTAPLPFHRCTSFSSVSYYIRALIMQNSFLWIYYCSNSNRRHEFSVENFCGQLLSSYFLVRTTFSKDTFSEQLVSHVCSRFKTTFSIYQSVVKPFNTRYFRT